MEIKKLISTILFCVVAVVAAAQNLSVTYVAKNAVRVRYANKASKSDLPDWLYVKHDELKQADITAVVKGNTLTLKDKTGKTVFKATAHQLAGSEATLAFNSPKDECLFGLGQFQDGYSNVRGLSRRLTQVNTQISIPMLSSSKGYGILWNNYG